MKKVLPIALAALVLSVCTAFAEPPVTAVADYHSGDDNRGLEQLSDADIVGVMGGMSPSDVCTGAVEGVGAAAVTIGRLFALHAVHVSGAFVQIFAAQVCT